MKRQIARAHERCPGEISAYGSWLDDAQNLCERAGLLDDERLCDGLLRSYTRRGYSIRDIRQRLQRKGFATELIQRHIEALREAVRDAQGASVDLLAALRYARKARLGPYARTEQDWKTRQKALARLARRGFSYDIASRALGMPQSEAEAHLTEF
ncbi:MAG: RecX family transcriptional regulator [Myxococcota bacterium]|nr:RecX family transcriptional regulator [Myxococcota bacterium]